MIALLVAYDKADRPHLLRWTVRDIKDLNQAVRVVHGLVRRHKVDGCRSCPATHYTVSFIDPLTQLWSLAKADRLTNVS